MEYLYKSSAALKNIPQTIKLFLTRAFLIFIIWKFLYHLILVPLQFPDRPLTRFTAVSTALFYNNVSGEDVKIQNKLLKEEGYNSSILFIKNIKAIGIADPCNGLELFILYVGFLLCIPEKRVKKILYIFLGMGGIYILNILRCAGIAWLNLHYISLADFAHHYFFKMIIYGLIFLTWVRFSKRYFNA